MIRCAKIGHVPTYVKFVQFFKLQFTISSNILKLSQLNFYDVYNTLITKYMMFTELVYHKQRLRKVLFSEHV